MAISQEGYYRWKSAR